MFMDIEERIEKRLNEVRKNKLINLLNDKSNYFIDFLVDIIGDKSYKIVFKRNPVSVFGYFSKFDELKSDIDDNLKSINDYTFSMSTVDDLDDEMYEFVPYTIERMIDEIINPATFVDITYVRKGADELNYRNSIINAMLDEKTKEIEIFITYPGNRYHDPDAHYYKAFKTNDGWKAEYDGFITDVVAWAVAKEVMDFNNKVWMKGTYI
jgi:hypothetical protein